jgi:hypothetical protein
MVMSPVGFVPGTDSTGDAVETDPPSRQSGRPILKTQVTKLFPMMKNQTGHGSLMVT